MLTCVTVHPVVFGKVIYLLISFYNVQLRKGRQLKLLLLASRGRGLKRPITGHLLAKQETLWPRKKEIFFNIK